MTKHRGLVAGASALTVLAGVAVVWILARPDGPEPSAWVDAFALAAVSTLFGLGMLALVDAEPAPGTVAVVAALWGATSLISAWLQVAERAGAGPLDVGLRDMATGVESGLPVIVCVLGALAVLGWSYAAASGARSGGVNAYVVGAIAAVGILVSSVTGHAGQSSWVPLVVGVHAIAAAWWVGTLAALVLTVRGRGGWARSLPVFSERAIVVVGVLTVTGVIAGVAQIGIGSQWWDTGYGRVLVAKVVALGCAVAVAWWHRTTWLAKARRHGASEKDSIRHAGYELALLTLVLGLAAGLAATGV
ncbi:CopD family protein [Gordonia zhaorongruii]|uniref:CopD family protein n=1 Tax=Gordonia zhaorongruii TaxID=2597659 RepID=UPI0010489F15|nr:CopD family protein [Gordonia zhaorongruii]